MVQSVTRQAAWSPDSRLVVQEVNGLLLVADRDGRKGGEKAMPERSVEIGSFMAVGWEPPATLKLMEHSGTAAELFVADMSADGEPRWESRGQVDPGVVFRFPTEQDLERYRKLTPGLLPAIETPSADGSLVTRRLIGNERDDRGASGYGLAVEKDGRVTLVPLPRTWTIGMRYSVDVVNVPGWSGALPERRELPELKTRPIPTPTPEPPPSPVVVGPGPPFPAPKGERVTPQVAGIPVYPGAREVDGFMRDGLDISGTVQMFLVRDVGTGIMDWHRSQLIEQGFRPLGSNSGVAGEQLVFQRGRDRVMVSTQYIPREEDLLPEGRPWYGFIEKGRYYDNTIGGEAFFFVVTIRAPGP